MTRRSPTAVRTARVQQVAHLGGHTGLLHECPGHVLEQADQVQLLLVVPAQRCARLLAADGEHWHVVHPRVVEAGHQVGCAGPGGGDADAQLTGKLGVGAGHECGHFLVAGLDEADFSLGAVLARQRRR